MSLTRGVGSKFPCPICLVPDISLANIEEEYPRRTAERSQTMVNEAIRMNAMEREALLKSVGLHPVQVSINFTL